jgi:hypothetical protein
MGLPGYGSGSGSLSFYQSPREISEKFYVHLKKQEYYVFFSSTGSFKQIS